MRYQLTCVSLPGYECLLGALEMGFNVDGFLVMDEKTLINPWNFKGMFVWLVPRTLTVSDIKWLRGQKHERNLFLATSLKKKYVLAQVIIIKPSRIFLVDSV